MKTLSPARIQKVTGALYLYQLTLCEQYSARVRRQAKKIEATGRLFSFRRNTGMPTMGTIKNALRYMAKVEAAEKANKVVAVLLAA
jgi:hypothetical protein